jgi:K(+)-stimulated pyrophosphate-energized sodium pump
MNILIKLTCLIGLVIAPILGGHSEGVAVNDQEIIEVVENQQMVRSIEINKSVNSETDVVTATVIVETNVDGQLDSEQYTFTGTDEEVDAQVADLK